MRNLRYLYRGRARAYNPRSSACDCAGTFPVGPGVSKPVGNAIKYREPEFLACMFATQNSSKGWIFSVQDNGLGIETQYLEKIFIIFRDCTDGKSLREPA